MPCDALRSATKWIVEVHGPETPIVYKFLECGLKPQKLAVLTHYVYIYAFTQ